MAGKLIKMPNANESFLLHVPLLDKILDANFASQL